MEHISMCLPKVQLSIHLDLSTWRWINVAGHTVCENVRYGTNMNAILLFNTLLSVVLI